MGVMLVIGIVVVVIAVIVTLLVKFCKQGTKFYNLMTKLKAKIFWNSIIRTMLQGYLKIALGVAFAIYAAMQEDTGIANGIITIVLALIICLLPIFIAILMHKNREQLT